MSLSPLSRVPSLLSLLSGGVIIELNIEGQGWVICSVVKCGSQQVMVEVDPETEETVCYPLDKVIGLRVDDLSQLD